MFQELPIFERGWWLESQAGACSGEGEGEGAVSRRPMVKAFLDLAKEFSQFTALAWPILMGCHLCSRCFGLSSHEAESETEFQRQVGS